MSLDPLGPLRQALYVSTLADLGAAKVVKRGLFAMVEDHGFVSYVAVPSSVTSFTGTVAGVDVNWVPLSEVLKITPTTRVMNGTAPIRINGGNSATLAGDITVSITAASTSNAGSMSASDKTKLDGLPSSDVLTGAGTANKVAKFLSLHGLGDSSITDDGSTVDLSSGVMTMHDAAQAGSPATGVELLQAYAGQLIARLQSGYLDYDVTPANIAASSTKAPKIGQKTSQYTLTGPGTSTFTIEPKVQGQFMQANRSMYGLLLCTQRVEATATTGWAGLYLIEAHTDGSANIAASAVNIVQIGTCGGAGPTVTVSASGAANFTLSIANTFSGTLTGMWQLLYGHCGS